MNPSEKTVLFMGTAVVLFLAWFVVASHGADLPVPPIYKPESCLETGRSFTGQVLKADKLCRSGYQWVYQE